MPASSEVLIVGCGKMGSALLKGWLAKNSVERVYVVEPAGIEPALADKRVHHIASREALPSGFVPTALILAVKPQIMPDVVPLYRPEAAAGTTVLSIAAGQTIRRLASYLGEDAAIIRAMPNTPAAIGRGVTVAVVNQKVGSEAKAFATKLLEAAGAVEWVADEALLDPVTALSGSGPAYVFLMIEALAAAGVKAGLPADLAMRLARHTVAGAGELALTSAEPPDQLRRNVTSPNGTTQAALAVLMNDDRLQTLFDEALQAATRRSRELAD
jgi:pyrroline-5-carboxylate reductase